MERKEKHRVGNMPPDNKMADTVFAVNTPEDEPNIMSDLTKYGQLATADCEQRVANPGNKKFENIVHKVGHKGRFQIVLLLLTFFCGATVTVQNYRRCPDGTSLTQKSKLFRRGKKLFFSLIYE